MLMRLFKSCLMIQNKEEPSESVEESKGKYYIIKIHRKWRKSIKFW